MSRRVGLTRQFVISWLDEADKSDLYNDLRVLHVRILRWSLKLTWFVGRCEHPTNWPKVELNKVPQ